MKIKIFGAFLVSFGILIFLTVGYANSVKRRVPVVFSPKEMLGGLWNSYKKTYLEEGTYRTLDPDRDNLTTSEGESYTMLRAVWMGDRDIFDKSAKWASDNLKHKDDALYSWLFGKRSDGTYGVLVSQGGQNTASDADSDIALAYVFAYVRWKDVSYLETARATLSDMWKKEVVYIGGSPYLAANNVEATIPKNTILVNPSYFSPYAYRIFAEVDKAHPWNDLVATSYDILAKSLKDPLDKNKSAGLPPDWIEINKTTGKISPSSSANLSSDYGLDAMRVPWRLAIDWQWFGETRAENLLSQMGFLTEAWGKDGELGSNYSHDGKLLESKQRPAFYGANIGYFSVANALLGKDLYTNKLLVLYDPDTDSWTQKLGYYDDNWAWFGIALYNKELPNLAAGTFSTREQGVSGSFCRFRGCRAEGFEGIFQQKKPDGKKMYLLLADDIL